MRTPFLVVGLLVLACGSSDTSNPVAACNSFASAVCSKASSCGVTGITSACAGNLESAFNCANAACTSGTFNSGAASSCINAINGLSCGDASTDLSNQTLPSACDSVCQ
jgi:hypothetical protein